MAIIVDPDQLDRKQVIFGTEDQKLSIYPVGNKRHVSSSGTTGYTVVATKTFKCDTATFTTWGVQVNDIVCIFSKGHAGHYKVDVVDSQTQLTLKSVGGDIISNFTATTGLVYEIRLNTGGTVADGLTEQCAYSFSKEEWRSDSELYGGDNLIRYQFPFEPITSEQMEIGGGASHYNWNWFNYYTKKKIRTGGWDAKNSSSTTLYRFAGMRSLGTMDSDAQAYYQQVDADNTPANFEFLGAVNEAVQIWESGSDWTTYFKAFLRKKGKTYAQYNLLTEQNISALVNRLYSFPLSHVVDPAIEASDGEISGIEPWTNKTQLLTDTDGFTTVSTSTFTDSNATFQTAGVAAGDVVYISGSGADAGYWLITAVPTQTTLTCDTWEHSGGLFSGDTALTYFVYTRTRQSLKTDGVIADVSTTIGKVTSATSLFQTRGVTIGDMCIITTTGSSTDVRGVYKVTSIESENEIRLNTTDKVFPSGTGYSFKVVIAGMYLQYKWETITLGTYGNLTFTDNGGSADTITRTSGSWIDDGVTEGTVLTITGSVYNNGSYTVASRTTLIATLVLTDTLTTEGPVAATVTAFDGFKRTIYNVKYGFAWRLLGNSAELSDLYQYVQHQLRQLTDIDYGPGTHRGDVTDLLMAYASPTATTYNMYIDDLATADTNNATYTDATGDTRTEKYVSAGRISFNDNLVNDAQAVYVLFFTNDDAGTDEGRDYGTKDAIIVQDNSSVNIAGNVSGQSYVDYTYDYDGNVQRGPSSAGTNAPVTIIAIGLNTAQFFITTGTIARSKTNNFSMVSALERNYYNP